MKNRQSINKNAWKIYLANFGKLYSFTISIFVVLLFSFVASLLISSFDFGIIGLLSCAFGLIPLFFSYQIVIAKVSSGQEIGYNDLYSTYKAYFIPHNKGIYAVIKNTILTFIFTIILIWLSAVLYDFIYPDAIENAVMGLSTNLSSIEFYDQVINTVLSLDNYIYFVLGFTSLAPLFFFCRIKKNFLLPYFGLLVNVPTLLAHQLNRRIYEKEKKYIKSISFLSDFVFAVAFLIGYLVTVILIVTFVPQIEFIEYIIILGMAGGLLLSSFFLPPLMIVQCFMADHLHLSYLKLVKEQMVRTTKRIEGDDSIDDEKKNALKKVLDSFQEQLKKDDDNKDNHNDKN